MSVLSKILVGLGVGSATAGVVVGGTTAGAIVPGIATAAAGLAEEAHAFHKESNLYKGVEVYTNLDQVPADMDPRRIREAFAKIDSVSLRPIQQGLDVSPDELFKGLDNGLGSKGIPQRVRSNDIQSV